MSMLNDPSKIGEGIAVAFVATVYGVGLSNLILIPWGTKLKRKAAQRMIAKEVVKLGVVGIQEGLNPHFLQEKLEVFVEEHLRGGHDK
jgi:chemotaxis protein MotA